MQYLVSSEPDERAKSSATWDRIADNLCKQRTKKKTHEFVIIIYISLSGPDWIQTQENSICIEYMYMSPTFVVRRNILVREQTHVFVLPLCVYMCISECI